MPVVKPALLHGGDDMPSTPAERMDAESSAVRITDRALKPEFVSSSSHGFFQHRNSRNVFRHNFGQSSTCLPSFTEGHHPGLVLIHRKKLACSHVCEKRVDDTAEVLRRVAAVNLYDGLENSGEDDGEGRRIDEAAFRDCFHDAVSKFTDPSEAVPEEEVDLLMHFAPVDKDGAVAVNSSMLQSKLQVLLALHFMSLRFRESWLKLVSFPLSKMQVAQVLKTLNCDERVSGNEVSWVQEKFWSIPCDPSMEQKKLLLVLAYWYCTSQERPTYGLRRHRLIQRLQLERKLWNGLYGILLWLGINVLFAAASIMAGSLEHCRGIRGNLESQLELHEAPSVTAMKDIHHFAQRFNSHVGSFVPLSRVYFGGGHVWILQDDLRSFSKPIRLPQLMEPSPNPNDAQGVPFFIGKSFTLQAWVQYNVALPRGGLSLLQKSPPDTQMAASCWNWRFPPALVYGAHDFGGYSTNEFDRYEEVVSPHYPVEERAEANRSVLHTLIVTDQTVTFMVDDRVLANMSLPRPVTDCDSSDITLGDSGLTLGSVRFLPRDLSTTEVFQIYKAGSTWRELGRVITPQKMRPMTEVTASSKDSIETIGKTELAARRAQDATFLAAVLVAHNEASEAEVYMNSEHPLVNRPADPTLGYPYVEIFSEPKHVTAASKLLASGATLPALGRSGGFSLSVWVKFHQAFSGYLMVPALPAFAEADVAAGRVDAQRWTGWENACWLIWVGNGYTGFYTKTSTYGSDSDGPTYFIDDRLVPTEWQFHGKSYRHFVFSIDPTDTQRPLRVCIDGVCTGHPAIDKFARFDNTSFPPAASCAQRGDFQTYPQSFGEAVLNASKVWLLRQPLDNYPMVGWQMQTKLFDRVLTDAEVQRLFEGDPDPTPGSGGKPIRQTQACKTLRQAADDHSFRDGFGNNCYWYYLARQDRPTVCDAEAVRTACPVACEAFETCWGGSRTGAKSMDIWKQQMDFQTTGTFGTMCVAKSTTAEQEAVKCALNAPNFPHCQQLKLEVDWHRQTECEPRDCSAFLGRREELIRCLGGARWTPANPGRSDFFIPCAAIIEQEMPECAWDDSNLSDVAAAMSAEREWSISFWYESKTVDKCIQPSMRFLDGSGATFAWLGAIERIPEDYPSGPGWLPGCSTDAYVGFGIASSRERGYSGGRSGTATADVGTSFHFPGTKHHVMIGRKATDQIVLSIDDAENVQDPTVSGFFAPIVANASFLRVINVAGNIRMSPLVLRSYVPDAGETAQSMFKMQAAQEARVGPLEPVQDQMKKLLERQPHPFVQKTMLLVPPFLMQKRAQSGPCPSHNETVTKVHDHGLNTQCSFPYSCPTYKPEHVYTCPQMEEQTLPHFGNRPVQLGKDSYYMEFLASITDNSILVRSDGENGLLVQSTEDFLDMMTREATIVALFYSVEFEITSMLKITFDTSQGRVIVTTSINHLVGVRGQRRTDCIICLAFCLLFVLGVLVQSGRAIKTVVTKYTNSDRYEDLHHYILDCLLAVAAASIFVWQIHHIYFSESETRSLLEELLAIQWDGETSTEGEEPLVAMKQSFMARVNAVEEYFARKDILSQLATILCILLMVRVVYSTSAHPRIELVTRTFELASSDLFHFAALMVIIFTLFALLGTWLFGDHREEFSTPVVAFGTLIDSVLGPPGKLPVLDRSNSPVAITYVLVFHFLCLFFMLNFVLAIIVDSYTKVMEEVRHCAVAQNIVTDLISVFVYRFKRHRYKFPSRRNMLDYLKRLDADTVTTADLWNSPYFEEQELFPSCASAEAYYNHYRQYRFLTEDETVSDEVTIKDLGTLMAMTLHKIEQQEQRELRGYNSSLKNSSKDPFMEVSNI